MPPSKAQELRKELRKTWNKKGDDLVRELDEIKRINLSKTGTGGVFKYIEENTSIRILCQEKAMSCSAACVRQIISDYKGKNISEKLIRRITLTDDIEGTAVENIGPALQEYLPEKKIHHGSAFHPNLTTIEIAKILSKDKKPWIASIAPPGKNIHTVIIDNIENGIVHIRDPWSLINGFGDKNGVEALMKIEDFNLFWKQSYHHAVWITD